MLEPDPAPPADALELLPEHLWRTSIAVGRSAFYPLCRSTGRHLSYAVP